jgi:flagellar biosynthesis/type III secretory pathway protein FliH
MAFVQRLLERIRRPGIHARGSAFTLSDHVEELRERQSQAKREMAERARREAAERARREAAERARREAAERAQREAAAKELARAQTAPRLPTRKRRRWRSARAAAAAPETEEPTIVIHDDAASRWVPRRP